MSLQFNSHSDNLDIVSLINDLVNTDNTSYALKSKTRAVNKANHIIWTEIFDAYGGIQFDDSNQTDLPRATANLVSGQKTYAMPASALTVRGIEIQLSSGGVWQKLTPLTYEQIQDRQAIAQFYSTASTPLFYTVLGDTIELFPAPNYTVTSGFKVYFDRGSVDFASTDTSKVPGFASDFHDALAVSAALEYAKRQNLPQAVALERDWNDYRSRIKRYYSMRFHQMFPPRINVRDAVREYR